MEKSRFVLIGDIIGSKKYKADNRRMIQKELIEQITLINSREDINIVSNLMISQGDEIQGVFDDFKSTLLASDLISLRMKKMKVAIRFGIGHGRLITDVFSQSTMMDGPVYWNARSAIEEVKTHNYYGRVNMKFVSELYDDNSINAVLKLQEIIRNQWSSTQVEFCYKILDYSSYVVPSNKTIVEILSSEDNGKSTNTSVSSVSNRLKSTQISLYCETRLHLIELINKEAKL